jgi:cysteine-S-conjugate beta-lyase
MATSDPLESVPLERLRSRGSLKWRAFPPDVLPLWVAEMDVDIAPAVVETLCGAAREGDTGYASGTAYAEALAGFAERRWGWSGFPVDRCALVPDVMRGVVEALRLVTGVGDTVIVNPPVYPPFYAFAEDAGRRVVEAPLRADGRLDLDVLAGALERSTGAGRRAAYLLCSPHNPTGTAHTADELRAVAALADEHGARVVVDEIHAPLVLRGASFVPYLSVAGDSDAFTLSSASKGYNLAGLKAAVLTAGAAAEADLRRLPEVVGHGPSHLGVLAHTTALADGDEWLDAVLAGLDRARDLLAHLLGKHLPDVGWRRPQASYLAWLDCTRLTASSPTVQDPPPRAPLPGDVMSVVGAARFFLTEAKVALSPGEAFGSGGAGHVRLNFATSAAVLTAAIAAMGDAESAAAERIVSRPAAGAR